MRVAEIAFLLCITSWSAFSATPISLEERAYLTYESGNYKEAEKLYIQLIHKDNEPSRFNLELAALYKEEGDYSKALDYLQRYKEHARYSLSESETKEILLFQNILFYLADENYKAKHGLDRLIKKYKDYRIWLYRGLVYEELKDLHTAQKSYEYSLKLNENTIALYRLGKILLRQGKYERAIEIFLRLVKLDASFRIAYYYLGRCYLKIGNLSQAYRYLSKAKTFYPHNYSIKRELTTVSTQLGKDFFLKKHKELSIKRERISFPSYQPVMGKIPLVKVGILRGAKAFSFKSSGEIFLYSGAKTYKLRNNTFYTIYIKDKFLFLKDYRTQKVLLKIVPPATLTSTHTPFYILGVKYGNNQYWQTKTDNAYRGNLTIICKNNTLTVINVLNMEEYLYGVLPSEIYPSAGMEALKAQAVAARTIAFRNMGRHKHEGFDFCNDTHCQVYRGISAERKKTNMAVDATRGEVMFSGGQPITAFYHSNCGGCLRNDLFKKTDFLPFKIDTDKNPSPRFSPWTAEIWFKTFPQVFCAHTPRPSNFRWQRAYDAEDFSFVFGFPLKKLKTLEILDKGECEHIKTLKISKEGTLELINGDLKIRQFFDGLRSSAFKFEIKYKKHGKKLIPDKILFWGAGFGHSTGMCQEGAEEMAKKGYRYNEILHHYYKNIVIKKLYK